MQPSGADQTADVPDMDQRTLYLVGAYPGTAALVPASWSPPVVKQPDGGLATVAGDAYELVQDPTLVHPLCLQVPWPDSFYQFLEVCSGHQASLFSVTYLNQAPMTRSVANSMRQFGILTKRALCDNLC